MPSHNIYYTVAVTQYLLYRSRHTIFTIKVPSHHIYYTVAVTQYVLYRCRQNLFAMELPSHNIYYTVAVTQYLSVQCGRELNFLYSNITAVILRGQILMLYNWRPFLSITPRIILFNLKWIILISFYNWLSFFFNFSTRNNKSCRWQWQ